MRHRGRYVEEPEQFLLSGSRIWALLAVFCQADELEPDLLKADLPLKKFERRGGVQAACLISLRVAARCGPVARRHVAELVCPPTRATGQAYKRGPPLPRLGM